MSQLILHVSHGNSIMTYQNLRSPFLDWTNMFERNSCSSFPAIHIKSNTDKQCIIKEVLLITFL